MSSARTIRVAYDAGTLVVDGLDGLPVPAILRRDSRFGCWRALASERTAVLEALADLGVPVDDRTPPAARVTGFRSQELRPYQHAAIQAWELAGRRGLAVLPTGAGKTRIALAAMMR